MFLSLSLSLGGRPGEFRELYPSTAFNRGDPADWFWARDNGSIILARANSAKVWDGWVGRAVKDRKQESSVRNTTFYI